MNYELMLKIKCNHNELRSKFANECISNETWVLQRININLKKKVILFTERQSIQFSLIRHFLCAKNERIINNSFPRCWETFIFLIFTVCMSIWSSLLFSKIAHFIYCTVIFYTITSALKMFIYNHDTKHLLFYSATLLIIFYNRHHSLVWEFWVVITSWKLSFIHIMKWKINIEY